MEIIFEPLNTRTAEFIRKLRNDNREWFENSREITPEDQWEWIHASKRLTELNLVIKDAGNYEKVGFISVYDISPSGVASVGRMMMVDYLKHKGYMKRALIKVLNLVQFFGINELRLTVKNSNIIARDFYAKMGFVTYGFTKDTSIMRKILK